VRLADVEDLADARLAPYRNLPDRELRAAGEFFLVEGRLGVRRLLAQDHFVPHSFFLTPAALGALSDVLAKLPEATPVYRGSQALLNEVVGYNLHRGCLAAVWRGPARDPAAVLAGCIREGRPLLVLEELNNPENVGNVFRNAVAFGVGGVWLTSGCVDPLYRQATRVSMGGTLRVAFARLAPGTAVEQALREQGVFSVALTPDASARRIDEAAALLGSAPRIALLLGNEAEGLSAHLLARADLRVRIPLMPDVDSLNVATASGIALHHLARLPEA
jgi:tRNA G18 (ribose-2'-O)-methylase SpoU